MAQYRSPFGDTTLTKVFVGGLAWETPTDKMRDYFEQFGDILEAVIITDKYTGHSKGYGFVTFREPDSAVRACHNPNPMIDGRRTNCNIASQGRPRTAPPPPPPLPRGRGEGVPPLLSSAPPPHFGEIQNQVPAPQNAFVYPSYGYNVNPYTSGYGYHHPAMYHPQFQQQQDQYYTQLYGSSSSLPYPYGYSFSGSRATPFSPSPHRMPYGYLYYSAPQQTSTSPYHVATGGPVFPSVVQHPPLLATPPPTSSDSQVQPRRGTAETDADIATSKHLTRQNEI